MALPTQVKESIQNARDSVKALDLPTGVTPPQVLGLPPDWEPLGYTDAARRTNLEQRVRELEAENAALRSELDFALHRAMQVRAQGVEEGKVEARASEHGRIFGDLVRAVGKKG